MSFKLKRKGRRLKTRLSLSIGITLVRTDAVHKSAHRALPTWGIYYLSDRK